MKLVFTKVFFLLFSLSVFTQQMPDTVYHFDIKKSAYKKNKGPLILIDEAHFNFHRRNERFFAFSHLLEQDGYRLGSLTEKIEEADILKNCDILVISNPLNAANSENWLQPNHSAFTDKEIKNIENWVKQGGNLLLVADHMPFAGAARELAKQFGFEFVNGFAFTQNEDQSVFSTENHKLPDTPVSKGILSYEKTDRVLTFTGSAFKIPKKAIPVLSFVEGDYSLQPDTAWQFNDSTPSISLEGFHQGAILPYGKGRVAVFGEAAMFTAQIANGSHKVGFNSELASQNAQFVLNVIHWLDEVKKYKG